MITPSQDYNQIVQLFDKFREHKKTRVLSMIGFWRFLLQEQNLPAWLVRQLKKQVKMDPNLSFHLNTFVEDFVLTGALTGTLKESMCKLVLKNSYGYEENPSVVDDTSTAATAQISYRQATLEDVKALQAPAD